MTPIQSMFALAVFCIIAGLVICLLSKNASPPVLALVAWYIGTAIFVVGVILILVPILSWVREQLVHMLGMH